MGTTVSSEPFRALAVCLGEGGFPDRGRHLEGILDGDFTTSSELIAELGAAVVAIRKECRPLNTPQKVLIRRCLREVRKVWPGFGWSWWWPFRRVELHRH